MEGQKLEIVKEFKYLGFTWTSKLSLKPTIDQSLRKIEKALAKLKWLKKGRIISRQVLRQCFFAYVFPITSYLNLPDTYRWQSRHQISIRLSWCLTSRGLIGFSFSPEQASVPRVEFPPSVVLAGYGGTTGSRKLPLQRRGIVILGLYGSSIPCVAGLLPLRNLIPRTFL